jgi:hypothetical protein
LQILETELEKPIKLNDAQSPATVHILDLTTILTNPFKVSPDDFDLGTSRPYPKEPVGPIPTVSERQAAWFDQIVAAGNLPDVFVVAGHQVISEGWHNEAESKFLFLPTLLETLKKSQSARIFFAHIKLAVLWGCNTMTDLEPRGPHGEYLSPEEIKELYDSGPKGKLAVIGSADKVNTLEFYRARLAREYGPGSEHYEYTRDPKAEKCEAKPYGNCDVTNLDRVMPDSYLWDGNHFYNYPYMMKKLFPMASLIFGFSSASPEERIRAHIFRETLDHSYADVNAELKASGKKINNLLLPLISENSDENLDKQIIKSLRKNWTLMTDSMNRGRPSGSITPIYPDLDGDGVLGAPLNHGSPQYGPYEEKIIGDPVILQNPLASQG